MSLDKMDRGELMAYCLKANSEIKRLEGRVRDMGSLVFRTDLTQDEREDLCGEIARTVPSEKGDS